MSDFKTMKSASMITEKLVLMMSPRTPKTTSRREGTIVMKKTEISVSADVSAPDEKLGAEKPPPLWWKESVITRFVR